MKTYVNVEMLGNLIFLLLIYKAHDFSSQKTIFENKIGTIKSNNSNLSTVILKTNFIWHQKKHNSSPMKNKIVSRPNDKHNKKVLKSPVHLVTQVLLIGHRQKLRTYCHEMQKK